MYKYLLTLEDQLAYDVMEYLWKQEIDSIYIDELAEDLDYKKKKLLHAIERLQELEAKYPFFSITFTKKQRSLKIVFSFDFLLSSLFSIMLEEAVPFGLLDMLFQNKYSSLSQVSQQYYLSDRTIQRKFLEVKNVLDNYNIGLNLKLNKIFTGSEFMIRYFFHTMYWQVFDETKPKKIGMLQSSSNKLRKILEEKKTNLRNIDINKFLQIVSISFYRIKQNYVIEELPQEMRNFSHLYITFLEFRYNIMEPIVKENYLTSRFSEVEYRFLYYMFAAITTYLPNEIENDMKLEEFYDEGELSLSEIVVKKFEDFFGKKVSYQERIYLLVNLVMVHSTSRVFKSNKKIDAFGKTTCEKDYIKVFPELYKRVSLLYQELINESQVFTVLLSDNERLLFQYCMIFSLLFEKEETKIKVFHESKFGKIQEERQRHKLIQFFGNRIEFVKTNPDIILTDYTVDLTKFSSNKKIRVFKWKSFQSPKDWLRLLEFIENKTV